MRTKISIERGLDPVPTWTEKAEPRRRSFNCSTSQFGGKVSLSWLFKRKYSLSLVASGVNTFGSVLFQLGILYKLEVGARSDLYYASIVIPTVIYSLAFGALNNFLVPMFVEAEAQGDRRETTLLWNCLLLTLGGGLVLLAALYYPVLFAFPVMFRKLAWVDMTQVSKMMVTYSLYQLFNIAVLTKNCFLFARGRPVFAQTGVFFGWLVSLFLLSRFHSGDNLARIPLYLVAGNAVALLFPNLGTEAFFYRRGLLREQTVSIVSRTLPITAGTSVGWLEPAIDGVIASTLKQGSLTIYYLFGRVMLYIATAILSGYIQPVTKQLSQLAGSSRWEELRRRTNSVALRAVLVSLGISICSLMVFNFVGSLKVSLLRPYILAFRQNLPVFFLLFGYLFGVLGYAVYSNGLYILRRERIFLFASLATLSVGIILKLLGTWMFGLKGLAGGTSVYWVTWMSVLAACFSWAIRQSEKNAGSLASRSYRDHAI
jgi:peptidoglycan biosynthesis protein MviN/MurJ (putative lipid II flippase)